MLVTFLPIPFSPSGEEFPGYIVFRVHRNIVFRESTEIFNFLLQKGEVQFITSCVFFRSLSCTIFAVSSPGAGAVTVTSMGSGCQSQRAVSRVFSERSGDSVLPATTRPESVWGAQSAHCAMSMESLCFGVVAPVTLACGPPSVLPLVPRLVTRQAAP